MEVSDSKPESNLTQLIINYLPQDFRKKELYSLFITMGPIVSCNVVVNAQTNYSHGYGFVEYESPEDAAKAIEKLNGLQVGNKTIKVAYSRPYRKDELVDTNLYIRELPRDITEEKLQQLFAPFGDIVQTKLLKDKITGYSRGVGFVRFSKRSEAQAAITALHDTILPGSSERLSVRVSESHKDQRMAYYMGFMAAQKSIKGGPHAKQNNPWQTSCSPSSLLAQTPQDLGVTQRWQTGNASYRPRGFMNMSQREPVFSRKNYRNGNFPYRPPPQPGISHWDSPYPQPRIWTNHCQTSLISYPKKHYPPPPQPGISHWDSPYPQPGIWTNHCQTSRISYPKKQRSIVD